jgi:hypothetical protein
MGLNVLETVDPRLYKSLTISEFITAFGKYKRIMCVKFPERRVELDRTRNPSTRPKRTDTADHAKITTGWRYVITLMWANATEKIASILMCVTFVRLVITGAIPARISLKRKND